MPRIHYGAGSFRDDYDNQKSKSMDRFQNPGGVTGIPFEDDIDLNVDDFNPEHELTIEFIPRREYFSTPNTANRRS